MPCTSDPRNKKYKWQIFFSWNPAIIATNQESIQCLKSSSLKKIPRRSIKRLSQYLAVHFMSNSASYSIGLFQTIVTQHPIERTPIVKCVHIYWVVILEAVLCQNNIFLSKIGNKLSTLYKVHFLEIIFKYVFLKFQFNKSQFSDCFAIILTNKNSLRQFW